MGTLLCISTVDVSVAHSWIDTRIDQLQWSASDQVPVLFSFTDSLDSASGQSELLWCPGKFHPPLSGPKRCHDNCGAFHPTRKQRKKHSRRGERAREKMSDRHHKASASVEILTFLKGRVWMFLKWGCMRYLSIVGVLPSVDGASRNRQEYQHGSKVMYCCGRGQQQNGF